MNLSLQYIPRKQIVPALEQGFRLIADHEYDPSDWAFVMQCEPEREVTADDIRQLNALLKAIPPKKPSRYRANISRAASAGGQKTAAKWAWAEKKMREAT